MWDNIILLLLIIILIESDAILDTWKYYINKKYAQKERVDNDKNRKS